MGKKTEDTSSRALRQRAEELIQAIPDNIMPSQSREIRELVHELNVHQVELEMQNEELRQAEDRLSALNSAYRSLFDDAPVGYLVCDAEGMILDANAAAARLLGRPRKALLKTGFSRYCTENSRDAYYLHRVKVLEGRQPEGTELQLKDVEGELVDVLLESAVSWDLPSQAWTIRTALMNMTENKRLQAQLEQARKMEAIGQLAGGVAHDFNNLLSVINGYAELSLSKASAGSRLEKALLEILKAGQQAADLTGQLLAYSRKQPVELKVMDLNEFVAGMDNMLQRLVGEDVRFRFELGQGLSSIQADQGQLSQVLMNLVINAADAIREHDQDTERRITISTSEVGPDRLPPRDQGQESAESYLVLSVSDTGTGIDEAHVNKIFDPFFTTKEVTRGTGMGLATVYGIVKQNDGEVLVESRKQGGTVFHVYWPSTPEKLPADHSKAEAAQCRPDQRTGTVLFVEDHPQIQDLGGEILNALGYDVVVKPSGESAMRWLREHPEQQVDVLFTDVVMPGMSGPEMVSRARQLRPGLKVVYASGYPAENLIQEGLIEETARILSKPYSISELECALKEAINGRSRD
jgi:PAS domain S-box-containing protein